MEYFATEQNERAKNGFLTKSCYVTGTRCSKALFFQKKLPKLSNNESSQDRKVKREGAEVGEFARLQFPGGVLIDTLDTDQALDETRQAIDKGVLTLYEAAFMAQGVLIRADILTRTSIDSPWQLSEVKATTYRSVDASSKNEYCRDLAIQTWVLQQCKINLNEIFLMHLNHECVFPDLHNLFKVIDFTSEIKPILANINDDIQRLQNVLLSKQHPDIAIGQHCEKPRECQFSALCWKDVPTYSVFNIPRALNKWKLLEENRFSAAQLAETDFNSEKQKRALRCYQTNEPFYDLQKAHAMLETWTYPLSYFDLEAVSYPIPRYNNSRPYQDLPFQFSCHIQRSPEAELEHYEFLFDADADPREAFINKMLKVLPPSGSIVVYHQTYEMTKLKELANDFPQYAESIRPLLPRIVDLKKVIEESIYHPEFLGSYSIKKVAPVLLGKDVSYEHLAVGDGMEAVCKFQELVQLPHNDPSRADVRKALIDYCKQDTLLMVKLHYWVVEEANNSYKNRGLMTELEQDVLTQYSTESTSPTSAKVSPIVLDSTDRTRKILNPTIVKNANQADACLRIELIYERTGKNGFEPVEPPNLAKIKAGEALSCSLNSKETLGLYKELSKLYSLASEFGVKNGEHHFVVLKTSMDTALSKSDENALSELIGRCHNSPGFAEKLAMTSPELIENAYHYRLLQKKHDGIARYKIMLQEDCKEQEWQDFFSEHDWILGGICEIQILSKVIAQPILAGANVFGKNEKIADFLLGSQGNVRFTAVAEIKKSKTDLLKGTPYRGTYCASDELNGGLAQLRAYMRKWQLEGSRTDANKDFLESKGIYTIQPRGILIIGHLDQLKESREKRDSFELFRQNQKDVHIVTFDEVYYRAQHLLGKVDEVAL